MDLTKAFDTLNYKILLQKLKYYEIANKSHDLLESYLINITQYVYYDKISSETMVIKCGVPQGSILGPLLFIIYVNDIVEATEIFKPILFADDTKLVTSLNTDNSSNTDILNLELQSISNWLKLNKLSINIEKTKAIVLHNPQKKVHYPTLQLTGVQIEFVRSFNFLGIVMDEDLK